MRVDGTPFLHETLFSKLHNYVSSILILCIIRCFPHCTTRSTNYFKTFSSVRAKTVPRKAHKNTHALIFPRQFAKIGRNADKNGERKRLTDDGVTYSWGKDRSVSGEGVACRGEAATTGIRNYVVSVGACLSMPTAAASICIGRLVKKNGVEINGGRRGRFCKARDLESFAPFRARSLLVLNTSRNIFVSFGSIEKCTQRFLRR